VQHNGRFGRKSTFRKENPKEKPDQVKKQGCQEMLIFNAIAGKPGEILRFTNSIGDFLCG